MLAGLAVNELIVASGVTVMVAMAVTEPAELVAVSVYLVVAAGVTVVDPLAVVVVNAPGVMAMLVAPVVLQVSWALPEIIVRGLALKVWIVGGGVTTTVTVAVTEPAELVALSV
jgi:hypothetical protein